MDDGEENAEIEGVLSMGDLAALLGVTPQTVRLYERYESDVRYERTESGYRQFTFESVAKLFEFRTLSTFGLSLKDIAKQEKQGSFEAFAQMLDDRRTALTSEARRLLDLVDVLDEHVRTCRDAASALGSCRVREIEPFWHLAFDKADCFADNRERNEFVASWTKQIPWVFFAPYLDGPPFGRGIVAHFGLGVPDRFAHRVDLNNPCVSHVAGVRCIETVGRSLQMPEHGPDARKRYSKSMDLYYRVIEGGIEHAEKNGIDLAGPLYARLLSTDIVDDAGLWWDYWWCWFPIRG